MNRDKHIWEGWTVGDFIHDIEPSFDTIQNGNDWGLSTKFNDKKKKKK